jgi:sugar lactone lactonase YvrE
LSGVACGPRGEVFTAERENRRVQRLDAGGQAAAWFAIPAVPERGALALAVDDSMRVAVADERGGWLALYGRDGRLLAARTGLKSPRALAFGRDGSLLVAESGAARILRFGLAVRAPAAGRN